MIFKINKIKGLLHKPKSKDLPKPQEKGSEIKKLSKPKNMALPRPSNMSDLVGKYLVSELKMNPDLVPVLMSVRRQNSKGKDAFDFRIYDEPETTIKKVTVNNYTSFDEHPELILYEGWFDQQTKHVEGIARREVAKIQIFTEAEILQQIESLTEPGSTVSFFQTVGPSLGGPLGRGACIVELNPDYPLKGKKYNGYSVNAFGIKLEAKGKKSWDSNKPKDLAKWIKSNHRKRAF